jgi:hypothetical protein
MALNGTLEELAVLDVVQFVNQAHLSGVLVLKSAAEEAELFYRKGGLVHARLAEWTGLEVLVRIVDWTSGTFSFRPGAESPDETIRMDLHRAVMCALKTRDERRMADKKSQAERVQQQTMTLGDQLAESIASLEFVQQAAIFDATGMLASAARPGHSPGKSAEELAPLCKTLMAFNAGSVRGRLRRAILDDERGTVLVSGIQKNRWVVIVSERGTPLGAVTVGMGRLVARLDALGSEAQKSSREVLAGAV